MAALEIVEISGPDQVDEFAAPLSVQWLVCIVDDDQVGVNYEPDTGSGYAKTYGVGWFALALSRTIGGLTLPLGVTEPRFVTHQGLLVTFEPAVLVNALITHTKIGVEYTIVLGNDS
jgi:hypothetical protein